MPNASPAFLSYGPSIAAEQIASDLVERMIEGWRKADLEIAGAARWDDLLPMPNA
jgi:hypothetical protein